jgi:predicted nucleotidyltransferase
MKAYTLLLFCLIAGAVSTRSFAQDVIVRKDKQEIKAVVVEVTDTDIKYKAYGVAGGSVISIKKSDVFMTIYTNGYREYYDDAGKTKTQDTATKKKKKFLGIFKKG